MFQLQISFSAKANVSYRDGDVVVIRPSADGQTLDIKDNHEPDASVGSSTSVSSLTEGEHPLSPNDA